MLKTISPGALKVFDVVILIFIYEGVVIKKNLSSYV